MKVVLDTNVLVSGMISPYGTCGDVVRLLISGSVGLCVDSRILWEYEQVLQRPRFKIEQTQLLILFGFIEQAAEVISAPPLQAQLPDPDDQPFLEVAYAGRVDALVTGNIKHFPKAHRHGVTVMTPRDLVTAWHKD